MAATHDWASLFGANLLSKTGLVPSAQALGGKPVVGLYFSAHWCPPCRHFTPILSERYTALHANGKDVEIVFISADRDEAQFNEYYAEHPWLALPFEERDMQDALSDKFRVQGIPTLVFLDGATGRVITDDGRAAVSSATFIEDFPYVPKAVNDVGVTQSGLDEKTSLLVFMENSEGPAREPVLQALKEVAERELPLIREGAEPFGEVVQKFFTVAQTAGISTALRKVVKLPTPPPTAHEHPLAPPAVKSDLWGCDGCSESGKGKERFRCTAGCGASRPQTKHRRCCVDGALTLSSVRHPRF